MELCLFELLVTANLVYKIRELIILEKTKCRFWK